MVIYEIQLQGRSYMWTASFKEAQEVKNCFDEEELAEVHKHDIPVNKDGLLHILNARATESIF